MNTAIRLFVASALVSACGLAFADDWAPEKSVSCESSDGHRKECPADLSGYTVRDVDQSSRTECVVGRNWGYTNRAVGVDDGCRATFRFDKSRGGDHPRAWGYRDSAPAGGEQRVKCESRDGRRNVCDVNLRGYRIADVHEISRTDCDIGRNFGYDDRGVWVDGGCRAEFTFVSTRDSDRRDRYSDRRDEDSDRR
jgi:hypothetical protein